MAPKKERRDQKFTNRYISEFEFIQASRRSELHAFCTVCNSDISIAHSGRGDIITHSKSMKHVANFNSSKSANRLDSFLSVNGELQTTRAEVLFTSFLLEHNIPLAAADHAGPLFKNMFLDSKEAKKYSCGRTKSSYLVKELAQESTKKIVAAAKKTAFSVATDGSNSGDDQLYPIVITYFNESLCKVSVELLSLPKLSEASTGANIAQLIISELQKFNIPWENCLSLSCDNAPVMVGKKKGVAAFLKCKQPNLIVFGCLCHLLNLAAQKSADTLPILFDDLLIDIFYYLEKSTKRKEALKDFQDLCEVETHKILKHCCTRWLSLGKALNRVLEQWECLTCYFSKECRNGKQKVLTAPRMAAYTIPKISNADTNSKSEKNKFNKKPSSKRTVTDFPVPHANKKKKIVDNDVLVQKSKTLSSKSISCKKNVLNRQERIFYLLSSSLNKAYAYFVRNAVHTFEKFNLIFQQENPLVHHLKLDIENFYVEILTKFVTVASIKDSESPFDVRYDERRCQKDDDDLSIGCAAKDLVKGLPVSEQQEFFTSVRAYFVKACDYFISSFPWQSETLKHAQVADVTKRDTTKFASVEYFTKLFPSLLIISEGESVSCAIDALEREFLKYQVAKLPECIVSSSRADEQWSFLAKEKGPDGSLVYEKLSRVMLGILTLPHSNAMCERVFSVVKKNKTHFRSSMCNSTLEAILIAKSNMSNPCYSQKYSDQFLLKAKSATYVGLQKNL